MDSHKTKWIVGHKAMQILYSFYCICQENGCDGYFDVAKKCAINCVEQMMLEIPNRYIMENGEDEPLYLNQYYGMVSFAINEITLKQLKQNYDSNI